MKNSNFAKRTVGSCFARINKLWKKKLEPEALEMLVEQRAAYERARMETPKSPWFMGGGLI